MRKVSAHEITIKYTFKDLYLCKSKLNRYILRKKYHARYTIKDFHKKEIQTQTKIGQWCVATEK